MRPFNLTRIQEVVARLRWSVSHGHPRSRTFRFIGLAKRKYLAGHEERKKKRFEEEKRQEDKGALLKYMIGKGSQVPVNTAPTVGPSTSTSTSTSLSSVIQESSNNAGLYMPIEVESSANMPTTTPGSPVPTPPMDPADWPSVNQLSVFCHDL
ncbi:uncharacterized protein LOC121901412 isoform X6 [Thunnus maccoyii]|uniref:uncharacterized protein LOC121901412 isoform X6 n=1 Tax=Thunnus maccoyii TaxID=8240 RepID=UPI001C4BFD28|nr:uncharacterized protein LOC121901412 isoform X6 [Thunnus maccoyii]